MIRRIALMLALSIIGSPFVQAAQAPCQTQLEPAEVGDTDILILYASDQERARGIIAQAAALRRESLNYGTTMGLPGESSWVDAVTHESYSEYQPRIPAASARRRQQSYDLLARADRLEKRAASLRRSAERSLQKLSFTRDLMKSVVKRLFEASARSSLTIRGELLRDVTICEVLYGEGFSAVIDRKIRALLTGGVDRDNLTVRQAREVEERAIRVEGAIILAYAGVVTRVRDALAQSGGTLAWNVTLLDFNTGDQTHLGIVEGSTEAQARRAMRATYGRSGELALALSLSESVRRRGNAPGTFIYRGMDVSIIPAEAWARWARE